MQASKERSREQVKKHLFRIFLCFALLHLFPMWEANAAAQNGNEDFFQIEYIDVGQGDCALVSCDGHHMLIDGGPPDASSKVYAILKERGIDRLDLMIATHPDADHIGGLSGALNYAKVGKCYSPVTEHDTKTFQSLTKYLKQQGLSYTVPKMGDRLYLGSSRITVLGPVCDAEREKTNPGDGESDNNNSIVVDVKYGSNHFLFMGDAEEAEEADLLASWKDLRCDVLKVGHHGSYTSTSSQLLAKVSPEYAVISVGKNDYGHPHEGALSRLKNNGIKVFRTDEQGTITVTSDGKNITWSTQPSNTWKSGETREETQGETQGASGVNSAAVIEHGTAPENAVYIGNRRNQKLHRASCDSLPAAHNQVIFDSLEQAMASGFSQANQCKRCRPYQ